MPELLLLPVAERKPSGMGGRSGIVGALAANLAGFLGGTTGSTDRVEDESSASTTASSSSSAWYSTTWGNGNFPSGLLSTLDGDFGETSPCMISGETRIVEGGGGTVISNGRALFLMSALLIGIDAFPLSGHWNESRNNGL